MKKKNIIHIFGSMNYGGAEIRTIEVMDILNDSFNTISFCTTTGKAGMLASSLRNKGYNIYECRIYSPLFPFKFIRLLKENEIDIVHSHISIVSGYIAMLAYFAKINKRIVHFRSSKIGQKKSMFQLIKTTIMKMMIVVFATDIIAVNRFTMQKHFKNYLKLNKCKVLYNGIKSLYTEDNHLSYKKKVNLSINKGDKVVIHIGRFHEAKNHEKVINVFSEYKKQKPNSKLLLIGDNETPIGEKIKLLIKKLNMEEDILMLGTQSDIKKYLAVSDVLLFPSLWEGLPGVVLEALSAGVPVLCSDIGSNAEIAETNSGISLSSLNCSDMKWADIMVGITDKGKQKKIADNFLKSPFYLNNVIKDFESLYK